MIALGAEVTVTGPKGERTIPIDKFFTGIFATALAPDEILTEIRIPIAAGAKRRRLREAGAQGRRLCNGGRGRAGDARRGRHASSAPGSR